MARLVTQIARCTARSVLLAHEAAFTATPKALTTSTTTTTMNFVRHIATTHRCNLERRYTDKHEWVTVNDKIGTVGISDYAQDALGDVVFAQLPDVGSTIKKEEECGALESVKAASEIMSPCSGKVVEKNEAVENKPGLINTSCYNEGWLFKIELNDPEELKTLMDEDAYKEFLKTDPH